MKKNLLYLLAFITIIFAACNPLKDAINEAKPDSYVRDITITLDKSYNSTEAANTGIATTLNADYPQLGDGSKAFVNYNVAIKPVDSLLSNLTYTVTDADYLAINGNNFKNFAADKALAFLASKYPSALSNQLVVLNYVYYEAGATPSAGIGAIHTFIRLNGKWVKAYQLTPAQYALVGKGANLNFGSADEANLASSFNAILKADVAESAKAKIGDEKYISFAYYLSGKVYQRIKWMTFDGINWASKPVSASPRLTFLKQNGKWIPDPTIYYTMVAADYTEIGKGTFGSPAAVTNLNQHGNFDVSGGASSWKAEEIQAAIIATVLNVKYPTVAADPNVLYKITYSVFRGAGPTVEDAFVKTASGFEFVPEP